MSEKKLDPRLEQAKGIAQIVTSAQENGIPVVIRVNGTNCDLTIEVRGSRFISNGENQNGSSLVIEAAKHELANGGGRHYPVTHIVK